MIELGHYCLIASLVVCAFGMIAAIVGGVQKNLPLVRSAENCLIANFVVLGVASLCLWYLLLTDQFLVEYVASYSATDIPARFKFTAFGVDKRAVFCCGLWCFPFFLF